ncbi:MAG: EAL domain-containing protein [Pseudomonadota bacterium]
MAELESRSVKAGELLFAEGDAADCAYVIESGEIEVTMRIEGVMRCVAVLGPGELVGDMGLVDDEPRSASAIATADTRLTTITRTDLASKLAVADPLLRLLLEVSVKRLRTKLESLRAATPIPMNTAAAVEVARLEGELKAGINSGQMQLYVQPIVDMHSHQIIGFESLVRWLHPITGLVRPDFFIPLAERSGLIVPLGRWVLREACQAALRFDREQNHAKIAGKSGFISVNVSAGQFHDPEFIPELSNILRETKLDPARLQLEITESILSDTSAAKRWIAGCKKLGVRIALDDFGTGYSSLSYLHEFDIDTLKIDQSFVRRILEDKRSEKIIITIIQLSQALGLEIVAEGIETQAMFDRLATLGCHYGQGYLIARPSPIDAYFTTH